MWSVTHILSLLAGLGLLGGGLFLLHGHRTPMAGEGLDAVAPRAGPAWLTQQMRLVLGVSLMIGGYHVAAYGSPEAWFPLKVSRNLWWLVPSVIAAAVGATVALDRFARTEPGS